MLNYREKISEVIAEVVPEMRAEEILPLIEVPQDTKMGDYAFPCFRLARVMRKSPKDIAADIASKVENINVIDKIEAVNAYVNIFLSKAAMAESTLQSVLANKELEKGNKGRGKTVVIDFSSPNIAKAFHIGHIRSTVIGNSIYKIYDHQGYNVIRSNHLGDYGTQFGKMIVAYRRWGSEAEVEADPINVLLSYYTRFHVEREDDPTLDDDARKAFYDLEHGDEEATRLWKWFSDLSLREFDRVYKLLGIEFDVYDGESFYSDMLQGQIDDLKKKGLLTKSEGANVVDLSDVDLPPVLITKSDGSSLYCTRDLATAVYRKKHFDFYRNLYVVGSQQILYFKQVFSVLKKMGYEWADDCVHIPFGMVSLEEGTMSTRYGRVVFLEDVLLKAIEKTKDIIKEKNPDAEDSFIDSVAREVGIGAVVFQELSNNKIKDYTFSWNKVLNFEGETGPYVQYTHARCASVMRKAGEDICKIAENIDFDSSYLDGDRIYELIKLIHRLPDVMEEAGEKYEPSIITRHIIDLAQAYNRFYHDERILTDDKNEMTAKVAVTMATKKAIAVGLEMLGVKAPERM